MASAKITITASRRWIEVEADGQTCGGCGDVIYLFPPSAMELTIHIPKNPDKVLMLPDVFCDSCREVVDN